MYFFICPYCNANRMEVVSIPAPHAVRLLKRCGMCGFRSDDFVGVD